jgi:formylglycine-generating enzyme required for sulfatase activity
MTVISLGALSARGSDTIKTLRLEKSSDMLNWQMVPISQAMINPDGTLKLVGGEVAKEFYRLRIEEKGEASDYSLIRAGSFRMGNTSGDGFTDAFPVTVTVGEFMIRKTETTLGEWREVRQWAVQNGYDDLSEGIGKGNDHPVTTVSWHDVVKWCNAKSQKDGLRPCYTLAGAVLKSGLGIPCVDWYANGYRLPTEAEWEKSARGGFVGKRFPWGSDSIGHANANYFASGTSNGNLSGEAGFHPTYKTGPYPYTNPVDKFEPNPFGLKNVSGNVFEWCWDWYESYVDGAIDPRGPLNGFNRVSRGGSWGFSSANAATCSYRKPYLPGARDNNLGFRLARSAQ